jgi:hypothetical protein
LIATDSAPPKRIELLHRDQVSVGRTSERDRPAFRQFHSVHCADRSADDQIGTEVEARVKKFDRAHLK